jgi:predicted nucleic acid-binding protein
MSTGCLLDTNILLFLANPLAPRHTAAKQAVARLLRAGERLVIAPQVLYEFWSVATRPAGANGLGMTVAEASAELQVIRSRFLVLPEPAAVIDCWLALVRRYGLKGKRIHDAHLLATMQANGVSRLLTCNAADFPPVPDINILSPE